MGKIININRETLNPLTIFRFKNSTHPFLIGNYGDEQMFIDYSNGEIYTFMDIIERTDFEFYTSDTDDDYFGVMLLPNLYGC